MDAVPAIPVMANIMYTCTGCNTVRDSNRFADHFARCVKLDIIGTSEEERKDKLKVNNNLVTLLEDITFLY